MKKVFLALAIMASFGCLTHAMDNSGAADYPNSLNMTCAQAKAYISRNGTATLATGDAWASFTSSYCPGQVPAFVCTQDVRYCFVGMYCGDEATFTSQAYDQGTDLCQAPN